MGKVAITASTASSPMRERPVLATRSRSAATSARLLLEKTPDAR